MGYCVITIANAINYLIANKNILIDALSSYDEYLCEDGSVDFFDFTLHHTSLYVSIKDGEFVFTTFKKSDSLFCLKIDRDVSIVTISHKESGASTKTQLGRYSEFESEFESEMKNYLQSAYEYSYADDKESWRMLLEEFSE